MLEAKIIYLRERIMEMAALVEKMISDSVQGLASGNEATLRGVYENETRANQLEIEIDELCTRLIALHEPRAKDLRLILMIMKMNSDLERIGDHAVNIAQSAAYLIVRPPVKPLVDIPRLAEEAVAMLRDSIASFIREDEGLAGSVLARDDRIDALRDQVFRELITYMLSDAATIERSLQLMRVTQNLERAADLSTNICEDVIYLVNGKVVKHGRFEPEGGL